MRVCVVSFKECWQDEAGNWLSSGGFPLQMAAIRSLFHEMTLLIVKGRPGTGGIPLPAQIRVVPLHRPAGQDFWRKLSVILRLPHYLTAIVSHARKADVVHVPLPGDLPFLGMVVAMVLGKRLLARFGGSWVHTSETTLMDRVTKSLMRVFAGGRNVMLATGAGIGAPAHNMNWIFSTSISNAEVASVQPTLGRVPADPLRLVYLGRLSPEKGLIFLITALASLRKDGHLNGRKARLTVIGDGPQRSELAALAEKLGCRDSIQFTGQLNRCDLMQQLLQADVCVLPSLTESFCKARLDAMLCGVPVVTTEVGFGRQIIGEDGQRGWITGAKDTGSIEAALRRVLTESIDWPGIRQRCRVYVEGKSLENWSIEIGSICAQQWGLSVISGKLQRLAEWKL